MTNMVITRADAIEAIEFLPPYREYWKGTRKILYAKEDIIKALKEVPSADKPKGELISRADALKPFCIAPDGTRIPEVDCDNFPVEFSVEFIKKHLLSLPSIEAAQGEWIYKSTDESIMDEWVCSKCGDWTFAKTDFCPTCGARMKGAEHEID